jgi:hypothetical protein
MLTLSDLVELLRKADYDKLPSSEIDWEKTLTRCDNCGNWKVKHWSCKACEPKENNANL